MKIKQFFLSALVWSLLPCAALARPPQRVPPQVWENTVANVEKGTHIVVPKTILKEIVAKSERCPEREQEGAGAFDAYSFGSKAARLIAVKGGGACDCSPTGNCSFWVYRDLGGTYVRVLSTFMVQRFGFLKFKSHDLPDIVVWSHGSAFESGARLLQFNGKRYAKRCSWDTVFREGSEEAQIENNTCEVPTVKQSTPTEKR
jgi:hypothetical protein